MKQAIYFNAERQQKEAVKTCGDSYFPFTSDKTAYAVQHPDQLILSGKAAYVSSHLL